MDPRLSILAYISIMTYIREEYIRDTHYQPDEPPHWFQIAMIRLLVAFYCRLRGVSQDDFYEFAAEQIKANRQSFRISQQQIKPSRHLAAIKPLIPRELGAKLSPNQLRERCYRLSNMSRSHAYGLHYYRWAYWRIGAVRQRAKAPCGASGLVSSFQSCGLSDAHCWPD